MLIEEGPAYKINQRIFRPYDYVFTLDSGEKISIELKPSPNCKAYGESEKDLFHKIASVFNKLELGDDGSTECKVKCNIKNNLAFLSRRNGGKTLIAEIKGEYEVILCGMVFNEPKRPFNEKGIFDKFKSSREDKGSEIYSSELSRQVRSAVERVNKKAKDALGLERLIIYSAGKIQINEDYLIE